MANNLQQLMEFGQTAPQARLVRSPSHLAVPSVVACAVEGKTEKRQRLSASLVPFGVTLRKATEGHQTGFRRLEREGELRQTLLQHLLEALCVRLVLETHDEIIHVAHQVRLPLQPWLHHPLEPQVERIVKIEVAEHDAYISPLGDSFVAGFDDPVFQHPLDHPQDAWVSNTVLHKAQEPFVV